MMSKPVEKFTLRVKRTQYIEIEISEANGYQMPDDITGVVEMDHEIRNDPESFFDSTEWSSEGVKVESLKITEA